MKRNRFLRSFSIDPSSGGERISRLPFLSCGPVRVELNAALTFLIGENGSGKTTLLEAIAARCAIRPGGGGSYAETEDIREPTALSSAVTLGLDGWSMPKGLFLRADRFPEAMRRAGCLPMAGSDEWRSMDQQSRGESVLSLLNAQVDASEGLLYLLDEPETGLSPERQMALLCMLDELQRDGRSQALVATHSPILMSHPASDRLWMGDDGISRRSLDDIPHWQITRRFVRAPDEALRRLLG